RSGDEARLSHARTGFEHVREAEVADAHSVRSVEQHVAWLDVAMHDTVGVRVIERARNGSQQAHDSADIRTAVLEQRTDRPTGEEPHAHPRDSVVNPARID